MENFTTPYQIVKKVATFKKAMTIWNGENYEKECKIVSIDRLCLPFVKLYVRALAICSIEENTLIP